MIEQITRTHVLHVWGLRWTALALGLALLSTPVLAQSPGAAFCQTALAQTIKNLFSVIQFGGPLVGGVIALGATVALSSVRRSDLKRELKELRNQGIIWGVIVAPLGTVIIQFILNNVVAGGGSCAF
jgi:hypothetical protein